MKKLALLLVGVCLHVSAQITTTPNLGLQIPQYGTQNWQVPLTYNFKVLDMSIVKPPSNMGILYYLGAGASRPATTADMKSLLGQASGSTDGWLSHDDYTRFNNGGLAYTPEDVAKRGAANGYAPLDSSALLPLLNLPTIPNTKISGLKYQTLKLGGSAVTARSILDLESSGCTWSSTDSSGTDTTTVTLTCSGGGGGGSGTVNSGIANQIAVYPSTGTAVSGATHLSLDGNGIPVVSTDATGSSIKALELTASAITTNQQVTFQLGRASSTGNSLFQAFVYAGSNSNDNRWDLGFYGGSRLISVYKNGDLYINGVRNTYPSSPCTVGQSLLVSAVSGSSQTWDCGAGGGGGGGDASTITQTPNGSGATSTTQKAHNQGYVLPEEYGAAADGSTDDTTALTASCTAATNKASEVRLNSGKRYGISNFIVPNNCHIIGVGNDSGFKAVGSSTSSQPMRLWYSSGIDLENFILDGNGKTFPDAGGNQNVLLSIANSSSYKVHGVTFRNTGTTNTELGAVMIYNASKGDVIGNVVENTIQGPHFAADTNSDVNNDLNLINNRSYGSSKNAIKVFTTSSSALSPCMVTIKENWIYSVSDSEYANGDQGSYGNGISLFNCSKAIIKDNHIYTVEMSFVRLANAAYNTVTGNWGERSGETGIYSELGSYGNTIENNYLLQPQVGIASTNQAQKPGWDTQTDVPDFLRGNTVVGAGGMAYACEGCIMAGGNAATQSAIGVVNGGGDTTRSSVINDFTCVTTMWCVQISSGMNSGMALVKGIKSTNATIGDIFPYYGYNGAAIASVTLGNPTVVTTMGSHSISSGSTICLGRFRWDSTVELNRWCGVPSSVTSTTLTIPVDSTSFTAYGRGGTINNYYTAFVWVPKQPSGANSYGYGNYTRIIADVTADPTQAGLTAKIGGLTLAGATPAIQSFGSAAGSSSPTATSITGTASAFQFGFTTPSSGAGSGTIATINFNSAAPSTDTFAVAPICSVSNNGSNVATALRCTTTTKQVVVYGTLSNNTAYTITVRNN